MAQSKMLESPPNARDIREFLTYNGECKMCPVCQSHICLFFINFTDKMIMCENEFCDYPFGYEKPKLLKPGDKLDDGYGTRPGVTKLKSEGLPGTSSSTTKTEMPAQPKRTNKKNKKIKKQKTKPVAPVTDEEKIKKSIEDLARLNAELSLLNDDNSDELSRFEEGKGKIKNEKWIKNLHNLQAISGVQLLRPEEMGLLKKEEPAIGLGELKIDIGSADVSDVPSIRIEIHNSSLESGASTSFDNSLDAIPSTSDNNVGLGTSNN
ncbi:hypothetical protein NE865_13963 [Phthorimaea operculella]|nr:hypothetical protein NE865_13963 [Phthorimaea operculella]